MKSHPARPGTQSHQRAFTLVELMVAMTVAVGLAGTAVLLLVQTGQEQRRGYADTTVEERAYVLQANLTSCLRGMSSGYGITGSSTNTVTDTNGVVYGYTSIYLFKPNSDGSSYTAGKISANLNDGSVIYTPNLSAPGSRIVWMTNSPNVVLRRFYFSSSLNLDGSQNNSLVNVTFQMDDNGYSKQNTAYNIANIYRSFSVQMRCD
jgi:prepilin-type N-terminal cleavage/methylation domain-containing protein